MDHYENIFCIRYYHKLVLLGPESEKFHIVLLSSLDGSNVTPVLVTYL